MLDYVGFLVVEAASSEPMQLFTTLQPTRNHAQLIQSIKTKLFPLGDAMRFVPGHGNMSTFGQERRTNPFVGEGASLGPNTSGPG